MIVTSKFSFIHIHKTGGQFVIRILLDFFPDAKECGYHFPRSRLPDESQSLPAFAFLRNPWSWYVSWYAFNVARPAMNPLYQVVSDGGANTFEATVSNLVTLGEASPQAAARRAALIDRLPESMEGNKGSGLTQACIQKLSGQEMGYFSWLVDRMLRVNTSLLDVSLGYMESLRTDLYDFLAPYYEGETDTLKRAILAYPMINATPHKDYREYYSDSLVQLVQEMDASVIKLGKYHF